MESSLALARGKRTRKWILHSYDIVETVWFEYQRRREHTDVAEGNILRGNNEGCHTPFRGRTPTVPFHFTDETSAWFCVCHDSSSSFVPAKAFGDVLPFLLLRLIQNVWWDLNGTWKQHKLDLNSQCSHDRHKMWICAKWQAAPF